jgi:asparagine synthase (glutamine-hydrolysing)
MRRNVDPTRGRNVRYRLTRPAAPAPLDSEQLSRARSLTKLPRMARWLAGVFDPSARTDSSRLAGALAPHAATIAALGPLLVAYSGEPNPERAPLCLLDGFLDNAAELAAALDCHDTTDEQLLAAGWRRWGHELPPRMRGDFALLVWDEQRGEGLVARDQLGVRSLYLNDASGALCFASEMRHLLALLPRRPAPDPVSVAHWITMSNRPGSATLYEGVRRLDPGTALALDRDGVRELRYWAPRFREPLSDAEPQLTEQVHASLQQAVARKLSHDGLTGVLMSGGLDSSSVAALTADAAPGRVSAYCAVFPEHPAVDESALIAQLRETLHLPGITAEVRAGGLVASALESLAEWQLPLRSWGDFWALPLLRAAAASGVQVTLGGDGGDELFGARDLLLADRLRAGHPLQALALARELPGAGDRPARRDIARIFANTAVMGALPRRLHELLLKPAERRATPAWLLAPARTNLADSDDPLAWKRLDGPRWWAQIAHGLTRGVEETGVFEHQRRRAATAGLQARHPLFDQQLVELCLRLPPLATFDRYRSRPLLRAATSGLLPDAVRLRPEKALFDSLLLDTLASADDAAVRTLLCDPQAELAAYVDLPAMRSALFDGAERSFRRMWQVWRLASAECWLRFQAGGADALADTAAHASAPRVAIKAGADAPAPNSSRHGP